MKLPEKPPPFDELLKKPIKPQFGPELASLLKSANQEHYWYWDRVKKISNLPAQLTSETLWLIIKMNRKFGAQVIPLADTAGRLFTYNLPQSITKMLHEIDRGAPKLIASAYPLSESDALPHQMKFAVSGIKSMMYEAIASSQLEGAATSTEVAEVMLKTGRKPKDKSERMIVNNLSAMEYIKDAKSKPLTREMILEIHEIITEGTLEDEKTAGEFRKGPIMVIDQTDGTELYKAPPYELIESRIEKLIAFANADHNQANSFIHPVIKSIILHFWMAYEHPFVDGNGRTARALFYWFMLKNGYWLFEFLSISQTFKNAPKKYPRAFLFTEFDENDLTYFIRYNAKSILFTLQQLDRHLEKRQSEKRQVDDLLKNIPGLNDRQYKILVASLESPNQSFTIGLHQANFDVVYQTARADLLDLVKRGFCIMVKQKKKYIFYPAKDLKNRLGLIKNNG